MNLFYSVPLVIGSVLVSALIWWLFARQMTAKTVAGARTQVAVLGFQEFMNRVDADRIKRMPPDTFEKFLPYAMALGVEHHWAQAFDGIVKDPPSWYVSPNGYTGFSPLFFSSSMHSMASDMHQVFVSAPRASSSGSGFSRGGGFSAEDSPEEASAAAAAARSNFKPLLHFAELADCEFAPALTWFWRLLPPAAIFRRLIGSEPHEHRRSQLHAAFRGFVSPLRELDFRNQFRTHKLNLPQSRRSRRKTDSVSS